MDIKVHYMRLASITGINVGQNRTHKQLEGMCSLESTDPRESEIRAHLRP